MRKSFLFLATFLIGGWLTAQPAAAQAPKSDVEKYFPKGTDVVVQVNLNQLLGSTLLQKSIPLVVQKYGEDLLKKVSEHVPDDNAKAMLENIGPGLKENVTEAAVTAGMNQAKTKVQDFIVAVNSKEEKDGAPQIVMVMRSPELTAAAMDQVTQLLQFSMKVREEKVGDQTVYEIEPPNSPQSFFLALPRDGVLVMSPFKSIMEQSLKNAGDDNLQGQMKELWGQRKAANSLFVAGLAPKGKAEQIKHFTIAVTLDQDARADVQIECRDAATAREEAQKANDHFAVVMSTVTDFAEKRAELKPIADALKKVKAEVKGSQVSLKAMIKGDDVLKALQAGK